MSIPQRKKNRADQISQFIDLMSFDLIHFVLGFVEVMATPKTSVFFVVVFIKYKTFLYSRFSLFHLKLNVFSMLEHNIHI